MENHGSFNGNGFYDSFRVLLRELPDSLLQLPEMKEPEEYDWQDENGKEVYLDKRYFKSRNISLDFIMIADSEADFWNYRKALLMEMIKPGTIRLYIDDLQRSFFVYYVKETGFSAKSLIREAGKIAATFTLEFVEPTPSLFKEFTYLVDKDGNYLINKDKSKILMR